MLILIAVEKCYHNNVVNTNQCIARSVGFLTIAAKVSQSTGNTSVQKVQGTVVEHF